MPLSLGLGSLWNLFLAAIPVALAFRIARGIRRDIDTTRPLRWHLWLPLLTLWLAFLPNTCYLLTEWRHYLGFVYTSSFYPRVFQHGYYNAGPTIKLAAITCVYIIYSSVGLLALFLSVWPLKRLAQTHWKHLAQLGQPIVFVLCALGVYLGLVNRFNSWDLIHPSRVFAILQTLSDIFAHPIVVAMILIFGAVLWLLYTLFDIFMDGAALRFHQKPLEKVNNASQ